ncbi:MaoC/PaaZ C-terminal domain-containing protein [Tepidimonas sp.]|uniref:MaoC/PaaZ C-terminal domain-containing protein n=1 Tax=Tepidimonas sp. TaxID=2002775 RepID=UPI0028CF1103|nr:MaoC/PaaZ C-terminal domain-containing protein [Tepidimonas sp.]MDT7928609.1 MaoC/PaaZ C-terminal domain-containing protein [Tepidimonas sp.]
MKVFESLDALQAAVGTKVAVTDWLPMTQERVNRFAVATDDHQWVHVDTKGQPKPACVVELPLRYVV